MEEGRIEKAKSAQLNGLGNIVAWLEADFLKESSSMMQGLQEYAESAIQIYDALQKRNKAETEAPR